MMACRVLYQVLQALLLNIIIIIITIIVIFQGQNKFWFTKWAEKFSFSFLTYFLSLSNNNPNTHV